MKVRNPRTGRVLKNPERFIGRLQAELNGQKKRSDDLSLLRLLLRGEVLVNWTSHIRKQDSTNVILFSFSPGDKIAIVGKVISVNGSKYNTGRQTSEVEYEVLQTRRMPQDW